MQDESSIVARERRELIARRLPAFGMLWVATMVVWLVVFALEGRLAPGAVAVLVAAVALLRTVIRRLRSNPAAADVLPSALGACVGLGLAATLLVYSVGAYGEILAFVLLTLYLATALLLAWGWRAELTLLVATLIPWVLSLDRFAYFVPRLELGAAVAIGASLALAIAEGSARNVRQVSRRRRAELAATVALQASRDAYRDLADKARDLIWSADRDGRLTYVNEALAVFLGRSAAAVVGRSLGEFHTAHPANPDLAESLSRVLSGEVLPLMAVECTTPRGPRWVEAMVSAVSDEHGAIVGIRGISRDIQERQAAEDALRASEARYRGLVESAWELVTRFDPDGKLTFANDSYCQAIGRSRHGIVGQNPMFLVHPDDRAAVIASFREAMRPPYRARRESRGLTPIGWRWFEWQLSGVRDERDRVVEIQQVGRDVTARRRAEADLRESEERFRSAFDDAAIGMALTTIAGRTIRVNPALCVMLGYDERELLACTVEDVVHPDDRGPLEVDRGRLGGGAAHSYRADRRYLHRDGHVLWVHVTASMIRDASGAPLYFLGQIQDITERHRAEEALKESLQELQRSEEKLRLLARRQVAIREEERKRLGLDLHDDVCQELVGIGILVESLRRKLVPMPAEHAAEFDRVVGYLGEVVEHLRLLAREQRPLLLHDLGLDGSLRSLADGMSTPTLTVATEIPAPIPRLDEEAEVTVYRIAQEALANAVRHAAARRIVVTLSVRAGMLALEVRDDGRGFDPSVRPAVALGLASMEERALALGGRLEIRSAPGEGTTVALDCPFAGESPGRIRGLAAPSPTRSSSRLSTATTPRSAARD